MHDIKIQDVSFSYTGSDKLVLKDINVDIFLLIQITRRQIKDRYLRDLLLLLR